MILIDASQVDSLLDYPELIEALQTAFLEDARVPGRHHHHFPSSQGDNTLLLMPCWQSEGQLGIKIVTVVGANPARGLPLVSGLYLLFDSETGQVQAGIDGASLTVRRTACASALASRFLSRSDSRRLLMVGAGALAPHLIRAHCSVRSIERVEIFNHHPARAETLCTELHAEGISVRVADHLESAVREADIISCATPSIRPLVRGEWLSAGVHLDLVGSFTAQMREADDQAIAECRVFVDTREGALAEAGELLGAMERNRFTPEDVQGDLFDLCRGRCQGRVDDQEKTLFKSVGTAIEDLAAARLLWKKR